MNRCLLSAVGLAVLLGPYPARAAEPTKQQCVEADDDAQDLRQSGKLRRAREKLAVCAAAACPAIVREDCVQRLVEVDAATPHVVFQAKDGAGNDLTDVQVTIDGAPLAERLDGASLKVDPGRHVFVFTATGLPSVTKKLVLAEHDQGRREIIVLGPVQARPLAAAPPSAPPPSPPPPPAPVASSSMSPLQLGGLACGGAGVAGLIVGSVFGVMTGSAWSAQKTDCPSATNCPNHAQALSDHATISTDSAIATGAFVAGGVLIAAGAAIYFMGARSEATTGIVVTPALSPGGRGAVLLRGAF
jgi:hypothetical protein